MKIVPAPFLSSSNVPLDTDFPDTGTWYLDFHLSAFCVIIYALKTFKKMHCFDHIGRLKR